MHPTTMESNGHIKGERILELRKIHLKMTQQEFGKSIGLSTSGISRLENGRYGVTNPIKKLITEVYGVNEEWLLGKDVPVFVNDERFGDIEEFKKKIFRTLENASDDEWTVVKNFITFLIEMVHYFDQNP